MYKGEIVQCPNCSLDLYEALTDQYRQSKLESKNFKGIGMVSNPVKHQRTTCPECSSDWFVKGEVHVKNLGFTKGLSK